MSEKNDDVTELTYNAANAAVAAAATTHMLVGVGTEVQVDI